MEDHVYDVIVEGPTKNDANHIGDTVPVQVDKGQTWVLKGHLVH